MFWQTVLAATLLAARAHAGGVGAAVAEERRMAGPAEEASLMEERSIDNNAGVERVAFRRAAANTTTTASTTTASSVNGVELNADGTINMTAWEASVNAACEAALLRLTASSNPSGTCTCYNLPAMDNSTGKFEADLRLYQLSTPTGDFAGIAAENVQVGLSYASASVSPVTAQTASKLVVGRRDDTTTTANSTTLKLLQTYMFVGQIKSTSLTKDLNMAQLEALVMPTVTLSAVNSAGATVSTNVSVNEAAFVAGVFSKAVVMSSLAKAQAAVDDIVNGLHNNTVAFVLPGVQILLFPVGLVVISVWLTVGLIAIGFGMVQRISFREQYRSRSMAAGKGRTNTF